MARARLGPLPRAITCAYPPPVRRRADRLADLMADGATLTDAAYRMKRPLAEIEALWAGIRRSLGRQAA